MIYAITGDGKGKTSAGWGAMARAYGNALKCEAILFDKETSSEAGVFAFKIQIYLCGMGRCDKGQAFRMRNTKKDRKMALNGLSIVEHRLTSQDADFLLLDEILTCEKVGLLKAEEILPVLEKRRETNLIITGRSTDGFLRNFIGKSGNIVSTIVETYFDRVPTRRGIEY